MLIGLLAGYWFIFRGPSIHPELRAAHEALKNRDFEQAGTQLDAYLNENPADRDALLLAALMETKPANEPKSITLVESENSRKRLVNRIRWRYWMCGTDGLLKLGQGKSPVASCGEAIRSAG